MYKYRGDESVDIKGNEIIIHWGDNTYTKATCKEGDVFDVRTGVIIATAKKFIKYLDLDTLGKILNYDTRTLKIVLKLLLINTAGKKCLNDIMRIDSDVSFGNSDVDDYFLNLIINNIKGVK